MDFKMKENGFVTTLEYGDLHISGDSEYGFRPYQLLVSSIAVCSGGVLRKILEKQRIQVDDIYIHADVKREEEGVKEIESIHLHFTIEGQGLEERKIEKALALASKNCAMAQSVKESITVQKSFELKNKEK